MHKTICLYLQNFFCNLQHKFKFEKFLAFSLIELMISLITISCITAAFAPVITKRLSAKSISVGSGLQLSQNCSKFGDDNKCLMCMHDKCLICTKSCPDGEYKDTINCTCKSCTGAGAPFDDTCLSCDNETTCVGCIAGYAPVSRVVDGVNKRICDKCPEGKYSEAEDSRCSACPEGSWSNQGSSSCTLACPAGQSCANGMQTPCESGYYCPQGEAAQKCPKGTYSTGSAASCTYCTGGKWSEDIGRTSNCTNNCPAGYYCNNGVKEQCPLGSRCPEGSSAPIACPDGTTSNASRTACDSTCPAGYSCSGGIMQMCPEGTYTSSSGGATSCTPCPAGTWSYAGSSGCGALCPAGYSCSGGNQNACDPGTYSSGSAGTCTPCPEGTYQFESGQNACIACPDGKWSTSGRTAICTDDCPAGYACKDRVKTQCTGSSYSLAGQSTCTSCTVWHAQCSSCNSSGCTGCANGYTVSGTGCEEPQGCTGDALLQTNYMGLDYCMTRYNMGDHPDVAIPDAAGVTVVLGQNQCTNEKCCWRQNTSITYRHDGRCGVAQSVYPLNNRTVCNYAAAEAICNNYRRGGWAWTLPQNATHWKAMTVQNGTSSWDYSGVGCSMNICVADYEYDYYGTGYCGTGCGSTTASQGRCVGSTYNACQVGYYWASNSKKAWLNSVCSDYKSCCVDSWTYGSPSFRNASSGEAFSVRCIADVLSSR